VAINKQYHRSLWNSKLQKDFLHPLKEQLTFNPPKITLAIQSIIRTLESVCSTFLAAGRLDSWTGYDGWWGNSGHRDGILNPLSSSLFSD